MLDIPQVVDIINKWGLSIKIEIKKMLNMARRNNTSVDFVNKIPIREYGRNKIYQTSKYTILNSGVCYVHHDWYKNQRLREEVVVPYPRYGHEERGFKLVMQKCIYNILPKQLRGWWGRIRFYMVGHLGGQGETESLSKYKRRFKEQGIIWIFDHI